MDRILLLRKRHKTYRCRDNQIPASKPYPISSKSMESQAYCGDESRRVPGAGLPSRQTSSDADPKIVRMDPAHLRVVSLHHQSCSNGVTTAVSPRFCSTLQSSRTSS